MYAVPPRACVGAIELRRRGKRESCRVETSQNSKSNVKRNISRAAEISPVIPFEFSRSPELGPKSWTGFGSSLTRRLPPGPGVACSRTCPGSAPAKRRANTRPRTSGVKNEVQERRTSLPLGLLPLRFAHGPHAVWSWEAHRTESGRAAALAGDGRGHAWPAPVSPAPILRQPRVE